MIKETEKIKLDPINGSFIQPIRKIRKDKGMARPGRRFRLLKKIFKLLKQF